MQETNKDIQAASKEIQEIQMDGEKRTNQLERACINLFNTSVEQGKNIGQLTEDIRELRDGQKETNDRLNAVIFMVEKFFSGNGNSKK